MYKHTGYSHATVLKPSPATIAATRRPSVLPVLPPRLPPPLPRPLKHIRYAQSVTTCIAASCADRIVLCCDSRVDQGYLGSTESGPLVKLRIVGCNWCALLAGAWEPANELATIVSRTLGLTVFSDRKEVFSAVIAAAAEFKRSPFHVKNSCELLVSGFVQKDPLVLHIRSDLHVSAVTYGAIGEGGTIASVMLNQRDYSPHMRAEDMAYMVYEAKRCSERVGSVGRETSVAIQRPIDANDMDVGRMACIGLINELGMAELQKSYNRFFLRDVRGKIKDLDSDRYFFKPKG